MIKQVEWSENPVTSQQVVEFESDVRSSQLQRTENQVTSAPVADSEEEQVELNQPANPNRSVVESVGAFPNQLSERLGLTMPRWLLWFMTVVIGIILSGLLVSTLALWTPLWSNLDRTDEDLGTTAKDEVKIPLPGELWGKLSQYKLSRPMNILIMGIEPVSGTVDGSP